MCCEDTSMRCEIVKGLTISPTWFDRTVCVPPSLGLGLRPLSELAASKRSRLAQPELKSMTGAAADVWVTVTVAVAGGAAAWQCGAPWGFISVVSLRRMLLCCAPKELIPDLDYFKLARATLSCRQTLMWLFSAFLVPAKCLLQIPSCPPWKKGRFWGNLGLGVIYRLYHGGLV